jgi:hypothetical protein
MFEKKGPEAKVSGPFFLAPMQHPNLSERMA